jgi:hypothetical protein
MMREKALLLGRAIELEGSIREREESKKWESMVSAQDELDREVNANLGIAKSNAAKVRGIMATAKELGHSPNQNAALQEEVTQDWDALFEELANSGY